MSRESKRIYTHFGNNWPKVLVKYTRKENGKKEYGSEQIEQL